MIDILIPAEGKVINLIFEDPESKQTFYSRMEKIFTKAEPSAEPVPPVQPIAPITNPPALQNKPTTKDSSSVITKAPPAPPSEEPPAPPSEITTESDIPDTDEVTEPHDEPEYLVEIPNYPAPTAPIPEPEVQQSPAIREDPEAPKKAPPAKPPPAAPIPEAEVQQPPAIREDPEAPKKAPAKPPPAAPISVLPRIPTASKLAKPQTPPPAKPPPAAPARPPKAPVTEELESSTDSTDIVTNESSSEKEGVEQATKKKIGKRERKLTQSKTSTTAADDSAVPDGNVANDSSKHSGKNKFNTIGPKSDQSKQRSKSILKLENQEKQKSPKIKRQSTPFGKVNSSEDNKIESPSSPRVKALKKKAGAPPRPLRSGSIDLKSGTKSSSNEVAPQELLDETIRGTEFGTRIKLRQPVIKIEIPSSIIVRIRPMFEEDLSKGKS